MSVPAHPYQGTPHSADAQELTSFSHASTAASKTAALLPGTLAGALIRFSHDVRAVGNPDGFKQIDGSTVEVTPAPTDVSRIAALYIDTPRPNLCLFSYPFDRSALLTPLVLRTDAARHSQQRRVCSDDR